VKRLAIACSTSSQWDVALPTATKISISDLFLVSAHGLSSHGFDIASSKKVDGGLRLSPLLEVSTKSEWEVGQKLSAFYVKLALDDQVLGILNECSGWAGRRNDIAHGMADRYSDEFSKGWFLVPGLYNIKSRPLGKKAAYRYNTAIMDDFSERFTDLHNRLNLMTSMMGEWHRIAASERERLKIEKSKQA
jgi:hypothetical protein